MIVLCGKTASGKDTIMKVLVATGFKTVVRYTTRPIRPGEIDGVTYHYISKDKFVELRNSGFFVEWQSYDTLSGKWYYGTAQSDVLSADRKTAMILTPQGVRDVISVLGTKPFKVVHVHVTNSVIQERLKFRGDDREEAARRLAADNEDFRGIMEIADEIVHNNQPEDLSHCVDSIIELAEAGNESN